MNTVFKWKPGHVQARGLPQAQRLHRQGPPRRRARLQRPGDGPARAPGPLPARRPPGRPARARRVVQDAGRQLRRARSSTARTTRVYHSDGSLYFTDPPYGLLGKNADPKKELPFNGVYRLSPDGELTLLTKEMTYPNGIGLSPDEKTLYVANSDPEKAIWMAFPREGRRHDRRGPGLLRRHPGGQDPQGAARRPEGRPRTATSSPPAPAAS